MNNNLTNINQGTQFDIFNYKNLGQVRVQVDNFGTTWFCLNDVIQILEIKNITDVKNRLNPKGLGLIEVLTNGGPQQMTFIDQGNLYMAIGRSRKPEAQNFMNWVYREVLPSIANKGYYNMTNDGLLTTEELTRQMSVHVNSLNQRVTALEEWKAEADKLFYMYGMTGRMTIRGYAIVNNIAITNNEAKFLGGEATKLTLERGMCVDTVPDPRWGVVNTYPKEILDEVFSNYFTNRNN